MNTIPFLIWSILQAEKDALGPSISEKAMLSAVAPRAEPVVKRKKGPKGPNPLSVKKKAPKSKIQEFKKATVGATAPVDVTRKRKRQEAEDSSDVSVETELKPKRRRRRRTASRPNR